MIQTRRVKIEQGLEDAQRAAADRENAEKEKQAILKEASSEARTILDDTRTAAQGIQEEILEQARKEADKIIADAKEEAQTEFENMKKQIQKVSLDLSEKILENVTRDLFTKEEKAVIMKRSIQKIKNIE